MSQSLKCHVRVSQCKMSGVNFAFQVELCVRRSLQEWQLPYSALCSSIYLSRIGRLVRLRNVNGFVLPIEQLFGPFDIGVGRRGWRLRDREKRNFFLFLGGTYYAGEIRGEKKGKMYVHVGKHQCHNDLLSCSVMFSSCFFFSIHEGQFGCMCPE
jgi:hypothetical protein